MIIQNLFSSTKWNKVNFRIQLARMMQMIFILVFLTSTVGVNTAQVHAAELPGWANKTPMTINNPGAALADYQVQINLDASFPFGQAKADGSDLRVTAADETTLLPFWIESWNQADTSAAVFVKLSSLPSGNTTVYLYYGNPEATSASDAAAVFGLYDDFETLPVVDTPLSNAASYLSIPSVDTSGNPVTVGEQVHPDVIYFPTAWNGYHYWMTFTPYPSGYAPVENPWIVASNDNSTWVIPAGLTDPIATAPAGSGNVADPDLFYDEDSGQLWNYYVWVDNTTGSNNTYLYRKTSTDGVTWLPSGSDPAGELLLTVPNNQMVGPTVAKVGDTYYLWYVNGGAAGCSGSGNPIERRTSSDGVTWSAPTTITFSQPGYTPWHPDVIYVPGASEYRLLVGSLSKWIILR